MKKQLLLLINIVALCAGYAQERPSFSSVTCDFFNTDVQDNIYICKDVTLDKYASSGAHLYHYSNTTLGPIASVCSLLPSKILVFYEESGCIQLLNDKLAPIGPLHELYNQGLFSISLVSMINSNQIVLYDETNHNLYITDLDLNILQKTFCDFGPDFQPSIMEVSLDKNIFLVDTTQGIYVFNQYGTFDKRIAIPNIQSLQAHGNALLFLKDEALWEYRPITLDLRQIHSVKGVVAFRINNKKEFLLNDQGTLTTATITHP